MISAQEVWAAEAVAFGTPFGLDYQEGAARPWETENEIAVRYAETGGCATIPAWGFCLDFASDTDMSFRVLPGKARDPQTIRRVLASWFLGPNPQRGLMNPDRDTRRTTAGSPPVPGPAGTRPRGSPAPR